jgi:hypothetical protein
MTCPDSKTWDLLSMNLLTEDVAESLRRHSQECEKCSRAWHEAARRHDELRSAFQEFDCDHDQRREQLMTLLPRTTSAKEPGVVLWQRWLGGVAMIFQQRSVRWAAAALVPAACLIAALYLMADGGTAFAAVLAKVRQARTMVCDVVTTTTAVKGQLPDALTVEPRRGRMAISIDGDEHAVLYEYEQFGRTYRSLFTGDKAYVRDGDKLRVISSADAAQRGSMESWLDRLLKVREAPDRELGEQVIDGRRAIGFEIAGWKMGLGTKPTEGRPTPVDSESQFRVWVDVEQDLPMRIESYQQFVLPDATGAIHVQWDNIKWNVPVDPAEFERPSAEEIAKAETIETPAVDESTFIDVMRAWVESGAKAEAAIELMKKKAQEKGEPLPAEMSSLFERAALGAGYPERLDMSWLSGAFAARSTLGLLAETLPQLEPPPAGVSDEGRAKLVSERAKAGALAGAKAASDAMLKATAVAAFYQRLAYELREPEYFGATAKPGDAEAVLLKWRLDDGRYRVIYGDLHADAVESKD